jgi:hypothetical protein
MPVALLATWTLLAVVIWQPRTSGCRLRRSTWQSSSGREGGQAAAAADVDGGAARSEWSTLEDGGRKNGPNGQGREGLARRVSAGTKAPQVERI